MSEDKEPGEFLPITIDVCHDSCVDSTIIEGVMKEDWGLWKKDQALILNFDFVKGTATVYNDNGEPTESVNFALVVLP